VISHHRTFSAIHPWNPRKKSEEWLKQHGNLDPPYHIRHPPCSTHRPTPAPTVHRFTPPAITATKHPQPTNTAPAGTHSKHQHVCHIASPQQMKSKNSELVDTGGKHEHKRHGVPPPLRLWGEQMDAVWDVKRRQGAVGGGGGGAHLEASMKCSMFRFVCVCVCVCV